VVYKTLSTSEKVHLTFFFSQTAEKEFIIMQADSPSVVDEAIRYALANESVTTLCIHASWYTTHNLPPLNVTDARLIIESLHENPRFHTLKIIYYPLLHDGDDDDAVLNVFRIGLPLCTAITTITLFKAQLGNEGLERLLPAFYNISSLNLENNKIQGQHGGEILQALLDGSKNLKELKLGNNLIGPLGSIGLGQGLAVSAASCSIRLRKLHIWGCCIGNVGLANLLLSLGEITILSLTDLDLHSNDIQGAEGGRLICLLLQRFPNLKVLDLSFNRLGPLGVIAFAPSLAAAASQLEELDFSYCGLSNDGVENLVPDGQVNRSLTFLRLGGNGIQGLAGGEHVLALAARCTNLDGLDVSSVNSISSSFNLTQDQQRRSPITFSLDQQRRLDLLLDRKRLHTEVQGLGGSSLSVVFQKW
jgi:Leucine Rich repeat